MRDFDVVVPRDCIASNTTEENEHAIEIMETVLKADTRPSEAIDFAQLLQDADPKSEIVEV